MVERLAILTLAGAGIFALAGCVDHSPPPPRVPVPGPDNRTYSPPRTDPVKPMPWEVPPQQGVAGGEPAPGMAGLPPGYDDEPLLVQRPPEQRAFVDAYNRVGHPRLVVFVNRTLNGQVVPVIDTRPLGDVEQHPLNSSSPVVVEKHTVTNYGNNTPPEGGPPPGESVTYERPGAYDEFQAQSLDYEAIENILTDWMAANGQVTVVSPTLARSRLTKEQVDSLERGEKFVLTDIAQRLDADVFIQVQVHPTRQSQYGSEFRLIGEAINVRGGQSLGRAVVDVPPPLSKPTLNKYTRFVARKLMDDMTGAWLGMPAPAPAPAAVGTPGQPPVAPPAAAPVPVPTPAPAPAGH